ncbi:hypothetical protein D3C87_2020870 [compost metagenome]
MQRDVFVVFAGLRIAQDIGNLLLMRRAQHKGGIVESVLRQQRQRLRIDFEDLLSLKFRDGNVVAG